MGLDRVGVNSLIAVNQWIGVINGNLQSASRTGYKTTRANFTDGLGANTVSGNLGIPPSTLTVNSTKVEWGQGSVVNSDAATHFALNGDGFFVLHNESSNKFFVTRDGEFHWSNEGYLVNSSGLKVVSAGRDYIRFDPYDKSDIFSKDGYSAELEKYGDKEFLLLDFANRDNLRMSQYGSTVFELDGNLTTRVKNSFTQSTDGVTFVYDDPLILPIVDNPGFVFNIAPPTIPDTDVTIDFGAAGAVTITIDSTTTIQDIVDDINAVNPPNLFAYFDPDTDRISIENTVPAGANNNIQFSGTNGTALAQFFDLANPFLQTYSDGVNDTRFIRSRSDIDNSGLNASKDIVPGMVGGLPIQTLVTTLPTYTHNKAASYVQADASAPRAGASMILSQSSATDQFDIVTNVKPTSNAGGLMTFGFGQSDPRSFNTGGYELLYNPTAAPITVTNGAGTINLASGSVVLRQRPKGYDSADRPVVIGAQIPLGPAIGTGTTALDLDAANSHRIAIRLDRQQNISFSIDGGTVANFNVGSGGESISGFLTLRNSGNILRVEDVYMDYKSSTNTETTGEMVSVGISDIANVETGSTVFGKRPRTFVSQNALESSDASLTEYIPMLSIAQKVFSSISKIISTHNLITDDLNTLIR